MKFAREGIVVLPGRDRQYSLQNFEDTCHIFLVWDMVHGIQFLHRYYDMSDADAEQGVT